MKRVFWSAFAVSLIALLALPEGKAQSVDEFLGLETELKPPLEGSQKFTAKEYHAEKSWNVSEEKAVVDLPAPIRGQKYSIIPWETLDTDDFLSIRTWLAEREVKDQYPDWKIRMRRGDHRELAGKVLKCFGICSIYRGSSKASAQHLSQIQEGDELITGKDSLAWVFLMDGSLLRVSADSSVSVNEFNLVKEEFFFSLRLNQGHVFWHPRTVKEYAFDRAPETDTQALPLLVRAANKENYEIALYRNQSEDERLLENLELDETAIKRQINNLNSLRAENAEVLKTPTKLMLVAPNGTIVSRNVSIDAAYVFGGKSWFKRRTAEEGEEVKLFLRGYSSTEATAMTTADWYEVDELGRNTVPLSDVPAQLQILELLTKRIRSLELARELWVSQYVHPYIKDLDKPEALAQKHGYSLWTSTDHQRRQDFLIEYTRRIETTNLRSVENLLTKIETSGVPRAKELSPSHYQGSLNHYLLGLKNRYDKKNLRVREMNDLQYYVWILRHGKL